MLVSSKSRQDLNDAEYFQCHYDKGQQPKKQESGQRAPQLPATNFGCFFFGSRGGSAKLANSTVEFSINFLPKMPQTPAE